MLNERKTEAYCAILAEELRLATGCTEPIAVAYCAAKLREVLGGKPEKVLAEISGNILKNVKSVVVPNTGGRRGASAVTAFAETVGNTSALAVLAQNAATSGPCGAEDQTESVSWEVEQNNTAAENPTYTLSIEGSGAMADYNAITDDGTVEDDGTAKNYTIITPRKNAGL